MAKHRDIKAKDIERMLAEKHSDDVFVPECKNGPSMVGRHLRMDAWVMKKSWSKPLTIGYEVKVSRSDFMGDDKWHGYLDYCNEFYFVCPAGLIEKSELPDHVGLMWVAKTGTRLYTKRKAIRRQVDIPESLWRYIVMCRATIGRESLDTRQRRIERWRERVKENVEARDLGWLISQRIAQEMDRLRRENESVRVENDALAEIKELARAAGLRTGRYGRDMNADRLQEFMSGVPKELVQNLHTAHRHLNTLVQYVDKELGS